MGLRPPTRSQELGCSENHMSLLTGRGFLRVEAMQNAEFSSVVPSEDQDCAGLEHILILKCFRDRVRPWSLTWRR